MREREKYIKFGVVGKCLMHGSGRNLWMAVNIIKNYEIPKGLLQNTFSRSFSHANKEYISMFSILPTPSQGGLEAGIT